jgi:hypothetical protein
MITRYEPILYKLSISRKYFKWRFQIIKLNSQFPWQNIAFSQKNDCLMMIQLKYLAIQKRCLYVKNLRILRICPKWSLLWNENKQTKHETSICTKTYPYRLLNRDSYSEIKRKENPGNKTITKLDESRARKQTNLLSLQGWQSGEITV